MVNAWPAGVSSPSYGIVSPAYLDSERPGARPGKTLAARLPVSCAVKIRIRTPLSSVPASRLSLVSMFSLVCRRTLPRPLRPVTGAAAEVVASPSAVLLAHANRKLSDMATAQISIFVGLESGSEIWRSVGMSQLKR